ncbi:MAG: GNAT family N-acetyltransferase [Terriglobales bacterium]
MRVRKAKLCDAGEIHALMQPQVATGALLPRSLAYLCENIRDFVVIEDDEHRLVASGALHFLDEDVAELQSLVVHPRERSRGLGAVLVQRLLRDARRYQVWKVFALTHLPEFFLRNGFTLTTISELPQKFVRDCVNCPKLHDCHQVAVICDVYARGARRSTAHTAMPVAARPTQLSASPLAILQ